MFLYLICVICVSYMSQINVIGLALQAEKYFIWIGTRLAYYNPIPISKKDNIPFLVNNTFFENLMVYGNCNYIPMRSRANFWLTTTTTGVANWSLHNLLSKSFFISFNYKIQTDRYIFVCARVCIVYVYTFMCSSGVLTVKISIFKWMEYE